MIEASMTIKYFDTLEYVQKAGEIKEPKALAAYQVEKIEAAIESAVHYIQTENREASTEVAKKTDIHALKTELKTDIQTLKTDIQGVKTDVQILESKIDAKFAMFHYKMLNYAVRTGVSIVLVLGGMIAHGFHWI